MNKFLNIIYIKKTNKTSKQTKQKNNVKIERVLSRIRTHLRLDETQSITTVLRMIKYICLVESLFHGTSSVIQTPFNSDRAVLTGLLTVYTDVNVFGSLCSKSPMC